MFRNKANETTGQVLDFQAAATARNLVELAPDEISARAAVQDIEGTDSQRLPSASEVSRGMKLALGIAIATAAVSYLSNRDRSPDNELPVAKSGSITRQIDQTSVVVHSGEGPYQIAERVMKPTAFRSDTTRREEVAHIQEQDPKPKPGDIVGVDTEVTSSQYVGSNHFPEAGNN